MFRMCPQWPPPPGSYAYASSSDDDRGIRSLCTHILLPSELAQHQSWIILFGRCVGLMLHLTRLILFKRLLSLYSYPFFMLTDNHIIYIWVHGILYLYQNMQQISVHCQYTVAKLVG